MVLRPLPNDLQEFVLKEFNNAQNGFCWEEKALKLAQVIWTFHPQISIEVGVFGGKSFMPMAAAVTYIDQGRQKNKCYGIDVWEAEEASKNYEQGHKDYWSNQQMLDLVYEQCKQYVNKLNSSAVELIKISSKEYVKKFNDNEIELLHIDGNHSEEESYNDIVNWWPKLAKGGVLVLDDIGWISNKGVEFCRERGSIIWEYHHTPGSPWGSVIFFVKEKN
jgi:predicted O-methyltransferase YrrM